MEDLPRLFLWIIRRWFRLIRRRPSVAFLIFPGLWPGIPLLEIWFHSPYQHYSAALKPWGATPEGQFLPVILALVLFAFQVRWLWRYKWWVSLLVAPFSLLAFQFIVVGLLYPGGIGMTGFGALILCVIWWRLSLNPDFRGWFAEYRVAWTLRRFVKRDPSGYALFNSVLLQDEKHSTEIDHILVSRYGIFMVETKGVSRIHVTEEGRWFRGNNATTASEMHSPLLQNQGHVKALQAVLGENHYIPLVVLTKAERSGYIPQGVYSIKELKTIIKGYKEVLFDDTKVRALAQQIEQANKTDRAARKEHFRRTRLKAMA